MRLLLVGLLAAVIVPLQYTATDATPVTLSETIEGVPAGPAVDGEVTLQGRPDPDPPATDHLGADDAAPVPSVIQDAPIAFSALGASAPDHVTGISVRTSVDGQEWAAWEPMAFMDTDDGPDPGSAEERAGAPGNHTEIVWVGEANHLQLLVEGGSTQDVELTVIDSMHLNDGPVQRVPRATAGSPADASGLDIVSRAGWGADESLGRSTRTASEVHMGVVHHTAHSSDNIRANGYTRAEAPGLIRAMHRYHTERLGWADIGYNVLVDRYGTIYEGRKGGFSNGVIGAHASGFNTGSFGVAVIGNFVDQQAPSAAIRSLARVIAAKSAIHGIDPDSTTTRMGNGTLRPTIVGHRDVGRTACPGRIHRLLPQIRSDARAEAVRFPDVPATSPHRSAIIELADAGVTSGCAVNQYCPQDTLTRAQAATFVTQALELEPIPGSQFSDVPTTHIHAGSINALSLREWLIGFSDGTYRPWQELTRGQLATVLANSLELPLDRPATDPYPDVSRNATHAPAIAALADIGIRGNCGSGRFCADDLALRDSTASFVHMARQALMGEAGVGLSVTVHHVTEVDGAVTPSPVVPEPAFAVRVLDGWITAFEESRVAAGAQLSFTEEDGIEAGNFYRVSVEEDIATIPATVDGCSLDEVTFGFDPAQRVQVSSAFGTEVEVTATASYRCSAN